MVILPVFLCAITFMCHLLNQTQLPDPLIIAATLCWQWFDCANNKMLRYVRLRSGQMLVT